MFTLETLISFSTKSRLDSFIQTAMALLQRGREERGMNEEIEHKCVTKTDVTLLRE